MKSVKIIEIIDNILEGDFDVKTLSSPDDIITHIKLYLIQTGRKSGNSDVKLVIEKLIDGAGPNNKEKLIQALKLLAGLSEEAEIDSN